MDTKQLIYNYYEAFNRQDTKAMLALLSPEVHHEINQGAVEIGIPAFTKFLDKMNTCYAEKLTDIVIMVSQNGEHAAAEFTVNGKYLKSDPGLPPARGQAYVLPAGTFFDIDTQNNKIKRVTTYYNLNKWIEIVSK